MSVSLKRIYGALKSAFCPAVEGIHSEETFRAILRHERAVAERNGHYITVLAFFAPEHRLGANGAGVLGSVLSERLRATDVVGWLDNKTVGVVLPHTRVKDASLVAEQICRNMSGCGVRLDYKVYLYPHDEGGKEKLQRELPLPLDYNCFPSAGAVHGSPRLEAGNLQSSGLPQGDIRKNVDVCSFTDICVSPLPYWKRGLDILWCIIGLAVFGPLMVLIAIGIKIVSPGPVLFRQERIGFVGKPFMLFKFRSMKLNADTDVHKEHLAQLMKSNSNLVKLDNGDARLIPLGKIFRASGLDELPQIFNILRGDMSLVGPRPCVPYEYEHFSQWQKRRCDTYPGLTGLWQVSGKNKTTFTEMMRLDIAYGRRQTLREDLRILLQTIPAVLGQIRECSAAKR